MRLGIALPARLRLRGERQALIRGTRPLGDCGGVELPDGGLDAAPFISEPITVWHDGAHDAAADAVPLQNLTAKAR